jgi:hypothetical protein
MLIDILKDPRFDNVFSFLMGVFIILLIKPICKGDSCFTYKAPPMKEINEKAYKIGDTCYKFVPKETKCPAIGVIEPFQWSAASASASTASSQ